MKKVDTAPHRIDDYLQRIEAREKAERRKKILTAFVILLIMGIGATVYISMRSTDELRRFDVGDLTYEKVQQIFKENDAVILVSHAYGMDTVQSPEDYISLMDLVDQVQVEQAAMQIEEGFPESSEETEEGEDVSVLAHENTLQQFVVDIAGDRKVGQELVFSIEDYDPNVSYTLDFGNGYRRKVKKVSKYIYSRQGTYRLRLVASSRDKGVSVYNKKFDIEGDEKTVVADNSNSSSASEDIRPPIDIDDGPTRDLEDSVLSASVSLQEESLEEEENQPAVSRVEKLPEGTQLLTSNSNEDVPSVSSAKEESAEEKSAGASSTPLSPKITTPLVGAEIMPAFPGGTAAMARYFKRNYSYPKEARDKGVEGTVFVRFVVNTDGSLSKAIVVKGIGYGCDEEALRLVRRMPNWIPGEHQGVKVPIFKTIPIVFKLIN